MWYIVALIVIGFLFSLVRFPKSENEKKQINEQIVRQDKLNRLIKDNVIEKSKTYINNDFTKAIILDEINNKVHLFNINNYQCFTYDFKDIIKSEVIIDNDTIISTKRGNQILGSVVGGVIAGVPGMIIGGLSSEQITSQKVKNVDLKLTLNDMNNAIFKINFLSPFPNNGFIKDSPQVKNALTSIDRWQGYFNVILKQQNQVI
jgi:hypothetical protein